MFSYYTRDSAVVEGLRHPRVGVDDGAPRALPDEDGGLVVEVAAEHGQDLAALEVVRVGLARVRSHLPIG